MKVVYLCFISFRLLPSIQKWAKWKPQPLTNPKSKKTDSHMKVLIKSPIWTVLRVRLVLTLFSEQLQLVNAISTPMASKKLMKRVFKCAKKASKEKTNGLRRGVKVCISGFLNQSYSILGCPQIHQKRRKGIGCLSWRYFSNWCLQEWLVIRKQLTLKKYFYQPKKSFTSGFWK